MLNPVDQVIGGHRRVGVDGKQNGDLDPLQKQTLELAYQVRNMESLLGYFSFARTGIELEGANPDGSSRFGKVSTVMATSKIIREVIENAREQGKQPPAHVVRLLQQVVELSNASKFGFAVSPPPNPGSDEWHNAGELIFSVMSGTSKDAERAIKDIAAMESLVEALGPDQRKFAKVLEEWRVGLEDRSK